MGSYRIGKSSIHGTGAFATRDFLPGEHIGHALVPPATRTDLAKYTNHSDDPNVELRASGGAVDYYAARHILAGEELALNYRRMPYLEDRSFLKESDMDLKTFARNCLGAEHEKKAFTLVELLGLAGPGAAGMGAVYGAAKRKSKEGTRRIAAKSGLTAGLGSAAVLNAIARGAPAKERAILAAIGGGLTGLSSAAGTRAALIGRKKGK